MYLFIAVGKLFVAHKHLERWIYRNNNINRYKALFICVIIHHFLYGSP